MIKWLDNRNGKSGVGKKVMGREEAEALCRELNDDHPFITHEVIDAESQEIVFTPKPATPEKPHALFGPDELTDGSPMPFGSHKGVPMAQVPSHYLDFIRGADWINEWPAVRDYIDRTRKAINQDMERNERFE